MNNKKTIQTIFKLRRYVYYHRDIQKGYPTIRLHESSSIMYASLDEAENKIKELVTSKGENDERRCVCAYTIVEIPIGFPFDDGESLSQRIYADDGSLWGFQPYVITKGEHCSVVDVLDRPIFCGRSEEEIKFSVGDIVEIFGHKENIFHRENYVELAVITKVPPTKHQICRKEAKMRDDYEVILLRDASEKVLCPSISVLRSRFQIKEELKAEASAIICNNYLNDTHNSEPFKSFV